MSEIGAVHGGAEPGWNGGCGDPCMEAPGALLLAPLTAAEVGAALGHDMRVCYQPIVRLADRRPTGLEALARLHREGLGVLSPARFVPQAESGGLASPLTLAVAAVVGRDWAGADLEGSGLDHLGLPVALNVPLDVLLSASGMAALDRTLDSAGMRPEEIVLELTESRPLERLGELGAATQRLHRAGYALAIDDVGPEGRDAALLLALPFSVLKLDRPLVEASAACPRAADAIAALVATGHAAGMRIIAEGVADAAAWQRMASLGVDEVQGFLVAPPMAPRDLAAWHGAWTARA